jgi:hypothetical protein
MVVYECHKFYGVLGLHNIFLRDLIYEDFKIWFWAIHLHNSL